MATNNDIPTTTEELKVLKEELWAIVLPLHKKLKAADATIQEKVSLAKQIKPSLGKLQAVQRQLKEIAKSVATADLKSDPSSGDQQKKASANDSVPPENDNGNLDVSQPEQTASDGGLKAPSPTVDQPEQNIVDGSDQKAISSNDTAGGNDDDAKPVELPSTEVAPDNPPTDIAPANIQDNDYGQGEEAETWVEAKPFPTWVNSEVAPKKPIKNPPAKLAVLRFVAGDQVYCFGHLDEKAQNNVVQVSPLVRISWTEAPYYGIRVKFPRDEQSKYDTLFYDEKFHTVLLKFSPNSYTAVEDHIVTNDAEFEDFLQFAPLHVHAKAKEAKLQETLYRITFTYESDGIEQCFYPNQYSSSVPEIQAIFNAMALVPGSKSLSVFMWKYDALPAHLQFLYREQHQYRSSLEPYKHKNKDGMAAYVQWGKIKIPDNESRLDYWKTFSKYAEYHLMVGNAEAREQLREVELVKQLRKNPVKMTVLHADPEGRYYVVGLLFQDFKDYKKVIISAGKGLLTWEPPPIVKSQSELVQGERPARDEAHGWNAWAITDNSYPNAGADLPFFLQRPDPTSSNKYKDKKMPTVFKKGEVLKNQIAFYKVAVNVLNVKSVLSSLNNLRFSETIGDPRAEMKRAIICGGDQKVHHTVDILEGLSEADIAGFVDGLTPSQEAFITKHSRKALNGMLLLQGPAGSGKTTIIKLLVQIAHKRGLKVAIVTDSNSAADNVIDKVADKAYIAVRMHSMGLERRRLLQTSRKGVDEANLLPADPEPLSPSDDAPPVEYFIDSAATNADDKDNNALLDSKTKSEDEDDAVDVAHQEAKAEPGWQDDPRATTFTDFMLQSAEATYKRAKTIMSPDLRVIESALFTWILKITGAIPKDKDAIQVNAILDNLAAEKDFQELTAIMHKSREQQLNRAEWTQYGKLIETCASMLIQNGTQATVTTIAQLAMEWSKGIKFDWIITDEATGMSEGQFIQIWRDSDLAIWIGDQAQLGRPTMSKAEQNPFVAQLRVSPFVRFIDNGFPYFMLKEVMRMTSGLEVICSELFYNGRLKPGKSTELAHPSRAMTRLWQEKLRLRYPSLTSEPDGLAFPILLSVDGLSEPGGLGGTSSINKYNVSVVVEHVFWLVESGIARTEQIGIASPYAAQVSLYVDRFRQLDKPGFKWELIRIAPTEWWQGKQAEYMIVDLVRAANDAGNLGFVADGRRLNVILSRQIHALTIVGDQKCTILERTGDAKEDAKTAKKRDQDNRYVIKLFAWMEEKGRVIHVPVESVTAACRVRGCACSCSCSCRCLRR